jgi:hypothetical protein
MFSWRGSRTGYEPLSRAGSGGLEISKVVAGLSSMGSMVPLWDKQYTAGRWECVELRSSDHKKNQAATLFLLLLCLRCVDSGASCAISVLYGIG